MKKKDNQQSLGDVVHQVIDYYRLGTKLDEININRIWNRNMGTMIARHTNKVYLHDKVMVIELDSAALRAELSYGKEKIKHMINNELGREVVEEVLVK